MDRGDITQEPFTRGGVIAGMAVVASGLVLAALPLFMVGGLAVQIKEELGFTEASLGAAVTIGFLVGALSAPLGGRLADRIGAATSVYIGAGLSTLALLGLGSLSRDWITVVVFLCLGGLGVAVIDPGLAILVSRAIPLRRRGIAFGIKEASIPAATLAAGLAVPVVALTAGWRWAFSVGILPLIVVAVALPRLRMGAPHHRDPGWPTPRQPLPQRSALLVVSVAGALGITAASGVGIFLTDSAVAMGLSPANAGLLLAGGSVAGVVARITAGAIADRSGGPQFKLIAIMLAVGAATMALGGSGNTWLLILGTVGVFTGGWAWTGIYFLSLIHVYPERPGAVAGIGTAGLGVGNAAGPLLFGLTASSFSYGSAWFAAALLSALAALLMTLARRRFTPRS